MLQGHTYLYSPYKRVPLPPRGGGDGSCQAFFAKYQAASIAKSTVSNQPNKTSHLLLKIKFQGSLLKAHCQDTKGASSRYLGLKLCVTIRKITFKSINIDHHFSCRTLSAFRVGKTVPSCPQNQPITAQNIFINLACVIFFSLHVFNIININQILNLNLVVTYF